MNPTDSSTDGQQPRPAGSTDGMVRRQIISDFAPRPHAPSQPLQPQPSGTPQPMRPATAVVPDTTLAAVPPATDPVASAAVPATPLPDQPLPGSSPEPAPPTRQQAHERHKTAHSGLVGWAVFIVLAVLALAPLLPGKILQNFPGSSQDFSNGDQSLACATNPTNLQTTEHYDTKRGFPLVYDYATTQTLHGSCQGASTTATGGHSSQFNPLAGAIDIAAAGIIAIIFAKIWRFGFRGSLV